MNFQKTLLASMISIAILSGCGGSDSDSPEIVTPVNTAPVAQSDTATVENGVAITIDVLSNDTDAESDTLTITSVSGAQFGNAEIVNGAISYTPTDLAIGSEALTYEISDGKATASGAIDITLIQSVALSGIVTDSPIKNADVTITVGDDIFTTTTDENGRFEITVSSDISDAQVTLVGQGVGAQSHVTLTNNAGTFLDLLNVAMSDGERDLSDSESDLTKVTHISTAQSLLYNDYIADGGDEAFQEWAGTVPAEDLLNLAGFIKLLVDNPDYAIPEGQTTLSIFSDTDMDSEEVVYSYLTSLGLVQENGAFAADYLTDRSEAVNNTLADPLLRAAFKSEDISGRTWAEVALLPRLARDSSVYSFLDDGTGIMTSPQTFSEGLSKTGFLWSLTDGDIKIGYNEAVNAEFFFLNCGDDGNESLSVFLEQEDIETFLEECTDSNAFVEVLRETTGSSFSSIQARGASKLIVVEDEYKWSSESHEVMTSGNSNRSFYVTEQNETVGFSEDMLASGEWLMPVNTTIKFFQDGYADHVATMSGSFSYEALTFENGVIEGVITDEQGTYTLVDGKVSMTLEGTTITAEHLFDTEHYSVAMYSSDRNGQTYRWTGYLKNTNSESAQNLEFGQPLPKIWTFYINDGIEGLFVGGLPTLQGAYGYNVNPDGTMKRIYSNSNGTELKGDTVDFTWSKDGNKVTFNGTIPQDSEYSRQRVWDIVNVDAEGYVTILERFNVFGRFSPVLVAPRLSVVKLLDWSEVFPEAWESADFATESGQVSPANSNAASNSDKHFYFHK